MPNVNTSSDSLSEDANPTTPAFTASHSHRLTDRQQVATVVERRVAFPTRQVSLAAEHELGVLGWAGELLAHHLGHMEFGLARRRPREEQMKEGEVGQENIHRPFVHVIGLVDILCCRGHRVSRGGVLGQKGQEGRESADFCGW